MNAPILKEGSMAYYDSMRNGPIACKVLKLFKDKGTLRAEIVVTTKNKVFKKGYKTTCRAYHVFPKDCLKTGDCGVYRIAPYKIKELCK